jgi:hypothetical protein
MALIDLLRKLGILRFGAEGGVYRDAAERPAGIQMDGVFDSPKDVFPLDRGARQESPAKPTTSSN